MCPRPAPVNVSLREGRKVDVPSRDAREVYRGDKDAGPKHVLAHDLLVVGSSAFDDVGVGRGEVVVESAEDGPSGSLQVSEELADVRDELIAEGDVLVRNSADGPR